MVIAAHLVPFWLNLAVAAVMLASVAGAALTADWSALRAASARQHVLLGGLLALLLLWLMTFRVVDDVRIHLLGVTSLTLIVGWRFAVLGATPVLFGYLWWEQFSPGAAPLAWLFTVLVPATTTRLLAHVLRRRGLRNPFTFMLGAGFGGGLLSVLALGLLALPAFLLMGQHAWVESALRNWTLLVVLMFPEGFINGMLVTAFTVFHPDVVKTFDDAYYLDD